MCIGRTWYPHGNRLTTDTCFIMINIHDEFAEDQLMLAKCFANTVRYIDDLLTLNNMHHV